MMDWRMYAGGWPIYDSDIDRGLSNLEKNTSINYIEIKGSKGGPVGSLLGDLPLECIDVIMQHLNHDLPVDGRLRIEQFLDDREYRSKLPRRPRQSSGWSSGRR
jgi:hypothetical protein